MSQTRESVLDAALKLSEGDRFFLVQQLMESLPQDLEPMSEDELLAELDRRSLEIDNGTAELVPWSEVKKLR
jgi:putative addiction module component (TIGR02574 family)